MKRFWRSFYNFQLVITINHPGREIKYCIYKIINRPDHPSFKRSGNLFRQYLIYPQSLSLRLCLAGVNTFETSSVFIYEMIDAFGGVNEFYNKFFISAVCPLGFTSPGSNNKSVNYNYYDDRDLTESMMDFITDNLVRQIDFGIDRDTCFCLGTGKNFKFLVKLNYELQLFGKIISLEHPRFIMQYKSKQKLFFINKYLKEFSNVINRN